MILRTTGKDRQFSGTVLHLLRADSIWEGGRKDWKKPWRPVHLVVASDPTSVRAISANLMTKAPASLQGGYGRGGYGRGEIELPGALGYVHKIQQVDEQRAILNVYVAPLWGLKVPTGPDTDEIRFVLSPSKVRLDQEGASTATMVGELSKEDAFKVEQVADGSADVRKISDATWSLLMAYAPLWVAHLDRRLQTPIIHDPRFYQLVMAAFIANRLTGVSSDHGRSESRYDITPGYFTDTEWYSFDNRYGMARPLITATETETAQALIAEVTATWHDLQQKQKLDTTPSMSDSSD